MSFFNRKKDEVNTSTASKTINYTRADLNLDSSLVWDAWYDAETQTAYVNLENTVYAYSAVPEQAYRSLMDSYSIGSSFSTFKRRYGPSERLGTEQSLTKVKAGSVSSATVNAPGIVPKNLTYAPNATIGTLTPEDEPKRVPLTLVDEPAAAEKRTYTVHFESNGSKTYSLEAESVDAAVEALKQAAEMLGVSAKVTGVFVHLG